MVASNEIKELIERFENYEITYSSNLEKEFQDTFIDPLLKTLNWTTNKQDNLNPPFFNQIKLANQTIQKDDTYPTYYFRISSKKKFSKTSKKSQRRSKSKEKSQKNFTIQSNIEGLPLFIETNFKTLTIYYSKFHPQNEDNTDYKIKSYKYTEYVEKWDQISTYFSKEAIINGNHLKLLPKFNKDLTSESVDDLLKEIKGWRNDITRRVVLKNKKLNSQEIDYSIQRMIYYLIFFRFLEDKNILKQIHLKNLLEEDDIYPKFIKKCKWINAYYNLCFNLKESDDSLTDNAMFQNLAIDDEIFKQIIVRTYGYDFNNLPIDLIARIYEEFLNEEITIKSSRKIRFKKNLGKNRITYNTDKKVTKKIIEKTVAKVIDGKTPEEISKIRILDPRCHSGNFLIDAYNYLVKYHLNYYRRFDKSNKDLLFKYNNEYYLTLGEKKRILSNNIFGIDEDIKATEVAKLSLLLAVLDYPIKSQKRRRQIYTKLGKLPSFSKNIKYGNILQDLDIYDYIEDSLCDSQHPINCDNEFNKIQCDLRKGFDIIIGNLSNEKFEDLSDGYKNYLDNTYNYYSPEINAQICIYEKSLRLLKKEGKFGFLTSKKDTQGLYEFILKDLVSTSDAHEFDIESIEDLKEYPNLRIIVFKKNMDETNKKVAHNLDNETITIKEDSIKIDDNYLVNLINKINEKGSIRNLNRFVNQVGIETGKKDVFIIDSKTREKLIREDSKSAEIIKPLISFTPGSTNKVILDKFLINTEYDINVEKKYFAIYRYLFKYKTDLLARKNNYHGVHWYNFEQYPYETLKKPKIIYSNKRKNFVHFFDYKGIYNMLKSSYYIYSVNDDDFDIILLNSILSSKLFEFYIKSNVERYSNDNRFNFNKVIDTLPIIDFNKSDTRICKLKKISDELLNENKKLDKLEKDYYDARLLDKRIDIKNRIIYIRSKIRDINRKIDSIVYELYDINDEEVRVIEEFLHSDD